jgi:hypothetical protein
MAKEDKIADVVEASLPDDAGYEYVQVGDVKHHRGDMPAKRWAKVKAHYEKDSDWVKSKNADGTVTAKAEPPEAKAAPPPSTIDPDNELQLGGPGVDNAVRPSSVPTDVPVTGAKGGSGLNKVGEWADSTRMGGAINPSDKAIAEAATQFDAPTPEENALADTASSLPGATTEPLPQKTTATPAGEAAPVEGLADKINGAADRMNKVGLGMALGGPAGAIYAAVPDSPEAPGAMGEKNVAPTPEVAESSVPMPEMPSPVGAQAALVTPGKLPTISPEEAALRKHADEENKQLEVDLKKKKGEYLAASAAATEAAATEKSILENNAREIEGFRNEAVAKSEQLMAARTATLEEASRRASQGLDPDRFWNSRDTGQKVAAVVAGALFGFNNQGMQWLQRLDTLVQNDVRMQESDRESAVAGLKAKAAGYFDAAEHALKMGSYKGETLSIAAATRWKAIEIQFAKVKSMSDDMAVIEKANAGIQGAIEMQTKNLEVARQIGERQVKMDFDAAVHNSSMKTSVNLANAAHANQFAIAKYKADAAAAGTANGVGKGVAGMRTKLAAMEGAAAELAAEIDGRPSNPKDPNSKRVGGLKDANWGEGILRWAATSDAGKALGKVVPAVAKTGPGLVSARQMLIARATQNSEIRAALAPQIKLAMEAAGDVSPGGTKVFESHMRKLHEALTQNIAALRNQMPKDTPAAIGYTPPDISPEE